MVYLPYNYRLSSCLVFPSHPLALKAFLFQGASVLKVPQQLNSLIVLCCEWNSKCLDTILGNCYCVLENYLIYKAKFVYVYMSVKGSQTA